MSLLPFYKELKLQGFKRTHRNRSDQGCHIYERNLDAIKLDLQLWPDGHHRVSHWIGGRMNTVPTMFTTVAGMKAAIDKEYGKAQERLTAAWGHRWHPMELAPKGGGAESVTDPAWVEPPKILMLFPKGQQCVVSWDWYYAEGGAGFSKDCGAWVEPVSGELAQMHFGKPIGWMHLPLSD